MLARMFCGECKPTLTSLSSYFFFEKEERCHSWAQGRTPWLGSGHVPRLQAYHLGGLRLSRCSARKHCEIVLWGRWKREAYTVVDVAEDGAGSGRRFDPHSHTAYICVVLRRSTVDSLVHTCLVSVEPGAVSRWSTVSPCTSFFGTRHTFPAHAYDVLSVSFELDSTKPEFLSNALKFEKGYCVWNDKETRETNIRRLWLPVPYCEACHP